MRVQFAIAEVIGMDEEGVDAGQGLVSRGASSAVPHRPRSPAAERDAYFFKP